MKKIMLFLLAVMTVCISTLAAEEKFNVFDAWRRGYDSFQKADKALQNGKFQEALELYKESKEAYLLVREQRPDWNQAIIKNRLELCESQISKIQKRLEEGSSSSTRLPDNVKVVPASGDGEANLSNEDYKDRYFKLFIEVENLRKQLREKNVSSQNLESLIKEKQQLENKYRMLERRYEELKNNSSGGSSEEFDNLQKLLIAERLRADNLEKKLQLVQEELEKAQKLTRGSSQELQNLKAENEKNLKVIESLRTELKKTIDLLAKRNEEIQQLKSVIAKNLETIDNLNAALQKNKEEISKLNLWIEELQRKSSNHEVYEKVLAENRQLKVVGEEMSRKQAEVTAKVKELEEQIAALKKQNATYSETIATLESRNQSLTKELANLREQYLLQQKTYKSLSESYEQLKAENKRNYENLNLLIAKNEELKLQLENRSSSEKMGYQEAGKVREEFEGFKKQSQMTIEALQENIASLEKRNRELLEELNALKTAPSTSKSQKFIMTDNNDYETLLAEYNALKEKYEFLATEIESLSKPVAEVEAPTINSDEELRTFLLKTADEALEASDFNSSCWYFEELAKQSPGNTEFAVYYALFKVVSDKSATESVLANIPDCAEKQLALNVLARRKGKNVALDANLNGKKIFNAKRLELAKNKIAEFLK